MKALSVECACAFVALALIKVHIHVYIKTTGQISLQVNNCPGGYQQPGSVSALIMIWLYWAHRDKWSLDNNFVEGYYGSLIDVTMRNSGFTTRGMTTTAPYITTVLLTLEVK